MLKITSEDYIEYIVKTYNFLQDKEDYITQLDLATGDGDHFTNLNQGFTKLVEMQSTLRGLPICQLFQKMGMTMMSVVGGSSGILYGGAYIAASKATVGHEELTLPELCESLNAMLQDMMTRGKSQPGWKTMIDSLQPAVITMQDSIEKNLSEIDILNKTMQAAIAGAESTKGMEAVRGRASYQKDKGIGHLDPGAVTMSYQIQNLCEYLIAKIERA